MVFYFEAPHRYTHTHSHLHNCIWKLISVKNFSSSFCVGRIIFQKPFKFYYQILDESHRKSFHAVNQPIWLLKFISINNFSRTLNPDTQMLYIYRDVIFTTSFTLNLVFLLKNIIALFLCLYPTYLGIGRYFIFKFTSFACLWVFLYT